MDTSFDNSQSLILEEEIDKDYEPSGHEVQEYAEWLGMDMDNDKDLLWIAKAGLKAPLPKPWKPCSTGEDGEVFYFNFDTQESVWDHPCDEYHRRLYQKERAKKNGLPYNEEEVEEIGRRLGLLPEKNSDDTGDPLENSAALGASASGGASAMSATSSASGFDDSGKKKKKKDKKEKKSKKDKKEKDDDLPKLEAPKTLAPLSARGPLPGRGMPSTDRDDEEEAEDEPEVAPRLSRTSSRAPSLSGKSGLSDDDQDEEEEEEWPASGKSADKREPIKAGEEEVEEEIDIDETVLSAASAVSPAGAPPAAPDMPPPPSAAAGMPPPPSAAAGTPPAPPQEEPQALAETEQERKRRELEVEAERARLEEVHKKNISALQAEHKNKLAKQRRELQEEFDLERDKAFGELQDKHEKQIRDEKVRLQQEFAIKKVRAKEEIENLLQSEEDLKAKLREAQSETARLRAEEASLSRKSLDSDGKARKLEEELNKLRSEASKKSDSEEGEVKQLKAELASKAEEVDRVKAELASKAEEVDRVKAEALATSERFKQWEAEMQELQTLAGKEGETKEELAKLKEEVAKLKEELKAKAEQCESLEKAAKDRGSAAEKSMQDKLDEMAKQVATAKADLEQAEQEKSAALTKVAGLEATVQGELEARDRLQHKVTDMQAELAQAASHESKLAELRRELEARSAECTALRQAAASGSDAATEEARHARTALEEERRASAKAAAEAASATRELAVLKAELDASAAECQRLRAKSMDETSRSGEDIQRLKAQLTEEREASTSAKAAAVATNRELVVLKAELDGRVKEQERLQARSSEEAKAASEEHRRLQGQVTEERNLATQVQAQLAAAQRELSLIKAELDARDVECKRLQERVAGSSEASQDELRRVQASLEQERTASAQARAEAGSAVREIANLKAELETRNAECGRLRGEVATAATTASSASATSEETRRLQAQLEEERALASRSKAEAAQSARELASLRAELQSWRSECGRLKAEASGDELRRLQSMVEEERANASRARAEAAEALAKARAQANAVEAELEARSAECGRMRAELLAARPGGGTTVLTDSEARELVALRSQVLDQQAEVETLRQQVDRPLAGMKSEEDRNLRAMIKDRDDTILRLRSDLAQNSATHSREVEELRSKITEARQEERLRRADTEGAIVADLKAQLRTRASDAEQLHSEVRASTSELERVRAEARSAEARVAARETSSVEAAKASVTEQWKRDVERLEAALQSKSADAGTAREQAERALREVRRLEQEESKVAKRFEGLQNESEQAQFVTQQVREEAADSERRLEDARTALRAERAARAQAEAQVREGHRELRVLKSHLQEQVGEADLVVNEARKCRHELADKEMEVVRLQEQIRALDAELREMRALQGSHASQTELILRRRMAELAERERRLDEKEQHLMEEEELLGDRRPADLQADAPRLGFTGLKTAVELSALSPNVAAAVEPEELTLAPGQEAPAADAATSGEQLEKGAARPHAGARGQDAEADQCEDVGDAPAWSDDGGEAEVRFEAIAQPSKPPPGSPSVGIGGLGIEPDGQAPEGQLASEALAALDSRRRELRRERAALEELRRQWKLDSHRLRSVGGTAQSQALLNEARIALDERAAVLNRAIDEFRSLERALTQKQGGRSRRNRTPPAHGENGGLGPVGSNTAAAALKAARGDTGGAATPRSVSGGANWGMPCEEADVIRRWQQILGPDLNSAAAMPPRSARGSSNAGDRLRSYSPLSGRRSRASREAVDQHLNWLNNFSREVASARPASARGRYAGGYVSAVPGRLAVPYF
eukprot:TRINITY_DN827_c0_g1_i1.p1 TRINITY_DN827_c0_g1~~TRINITY_DN827_c0_g1_i1.p1  ORF type:complete len:1806 (-),score=585.02 TRINITY_DN827_c0_g1_i1:63-5480(-)